MSDSKRKSAGPGEKRDDTAAWKRAKTGRKKWQVPRTGPIRTSSFQVGDAGIWATCNLNMEMRCKLELIDLFQDYAERLYGPAGGVLDKPGGSVQDGAVEIENEIEKELAELKESAAAGSGRAISSHPPIHISFVHTNSQCVLFFKTHSPVDPVELVRAICVDASKPGRVQRTRYARRLVPSSLLGKSTENGLESVSQSVLAPIFHPSDSEAPTYKFAIRPNIRHHVQLKRDQVIQKIAQEVGPAHKVDLTNYDHLILLEVHKNILGMSVVPGDYEQLKRYNIAELYELSETADEREARVASELRRKEAKAQEAADQAGAVAAEKEAIPAEKEVITTHSEAVTAEKENTAAAVTTDAQ